MFSSQKMLYDFKILKRFGLTSLWNRGFWTHGWLDPHLDSDFDRLPNSTFIDKNILTFTILAKSKLKNEGSVTDNSKGHDKQKVVHARREATANWSFWTFSFFEAQTNGKLNERNGERTSKL